MATKSTNEQGNQWHDDEGKFTSPNATGDGVNKKMNNVQLPSFAKKKATTANTSNAQNLPVFAKRKNQNQQVQQPYKQSTYEKIVEDMWVAKPKTVQEVIDNVDKFFSEDVLTMIEKYGFHTCDSMGAGKTSHSYINKPLLNAIAARQFEPLKIIPNNEFDNYFRIAKAHGSYNNAHSRDWAYCQRGFGNTSTIDIYTGKRKPDLLLPAGAYGSCIYTAYDSSTANSYSKGVLMSYVIDMTKAKTMTNIEERNYKSKMQNAFPQMENKIRARLQKMGKDQLYCDKVIHNFQNCLRDETMVSVMMGYDAVFEINQQYLKILNWRNVLTKKNWR